MMKELRDCVVKSAALRPALLVLLGALVVGGCNTSEGVEKDAEEAGEAIQDAADDAADAVDEAAEDVKDELD